MVKRSYSAINDALADYRADAYQSSKKKARKGLYKKKGIVRTGGYYGRFGGAAGELKFFDTALSFNFDLTAEVPATGQLNLVPQDDTQSGRTGRKICIKSISIKGFVANVGTTNPNDLLGLHLVQDTQCNGAAATFGNVFTGTVATNGFRNLENVSRFKVLKSWTIPVVAGSASGATPVLMEYSAPVNYSMKCNIPIDFDSSAATGAITTIRSNNVFLLAGSANRDDLSLFTGNCRIRYED